MENESNIPDGGPVVIPPRPVSLLAEAAVAIGRLEKDGHNTQGGGYYYLSEAAVKGAARKHVYGRGMVPDVHVEILSDEWHPYGKGGGEGNFVKVRVALDIEDNGVLRHGEGLGAGVDYADKALMKAQTAAIREAWKNLLGISDGNDPEGDPVGDEGPMSPEKASAVAELDKLEEPAGLRAWWKKHSKGKTGDVRADVWDVFKVRCASLDLDAQEVAK